MKPALLEELEALAALADTLAQGSDWSSDMHDLARRLRELAEWARREAE